jgi:uncharacterized protein YndB with AHSA1/START domain
MSKQLPQHVEVSVDVDADPNKVWSVISDPTRVGEWSLEACGAEWISPGDVPFVGARFVGSNDAGRMKTWRRHCEILSCDAPRELSWRTVPKGFYRDSTTWRISLEPTAEGTRIHQSYDLTAPDWLLRLIWHVMPTHRDRTAELEADLRRLGEVASGRQVSPA